MSEHSFSKILEQNSINHSVTKQWHVALVIFYSPYARNMYFTLELLGRWITFSLIHLLRGIRHPMVRTTQIDHEVWIPCMTSIRSRNLIMPYYQSCSDCCDRFLIRIYQVNCRFWSHNGALNPASWVTTETNAEGSTKPRRRGMH